MGVPQKPKTSKKCAKGKKSCKADKKSAPMWGGSPASAMLFDDLANPTNTGNYLNADIPLVANQTSKFPMTGGSLASDPVVGAANAMREPSSMLGDYESAMDLKGCGGKAVMTGGSIASNRVTSLVNLPGVLEPHAVKRSVPDYLSTEPRPDNYNLTGGAAQEPEEEPINNDWERVDRQDALAAEQEAIQAEQEAIQRAAAHAEEEPVRPTRVLRKSSKRYRSTRTVRPKASKRTSKMKMTGGGDRPLGLGPVPRNREELRNRFAAAREEAAQRDPEAEQRRQRIIAERRLIAQIHQAPIQARANIAQAQAEVAGNEQDRPRKRKGSSGRRSSKRKHTMAGGGDRNNGGGPVQRLYADVPAYRDAPAYRPPRNAAEQEDRINWQLRQQLGNQPVNPNKKNKRARGSSERRSSGKHSKKQMTGGASGFWSGVAGCGPVNVPNAGNTLSKFFTKSSSCPGPDFYANPPGLGSAGSGYETELPSGAPFPFI